MSIFRTIAMFLYLFGYMIVHYNILRRGERALAAGDMDTVEQIVNKHIPHWSRQILHITGVQLLVEGLDNIPKDTACVFVGNHRSYYDIPLLLAGLDRPHGILAKEELGKIPLLNRWMKLLGCVFVQRDDVRASVRALNDATAIVAPRAPATRAKRAAPVSSSRARSALRSRQALPWCRWPSPGHGPCLRTTATSATRARYASRCCPPSRPRA